MKGKINKLLWGGGKPGRVLTLGLQHVFAMFGSTVLVPALTGLDASVTLFCMGVGTLIFHLATKGIVLAFMGKVSGVLQSIPSPVMGGVSVILFGMIGSVGLRRLVENKVDFTRSRNLIIAGVMLVFGLGLSGGVQIRSTTISSTAIAAVLGIVLSKLLPEKDADERKAAKEEKR